MESGEGDSDFDFADVFGGPPRRSSKQVFRHSASTEEDQEEKNERSEVVQFRTSSWTNLEEKPVFGYEASNRQRHTSDDFYDDIFGGDEIYCSPRRSDRNPISSSHADPFDGSYHQFSLPAKLTKLESSSSSVASGSSRSSSPWRLSSDFQKPDEIRSRVYKPSPLSHSKEELPDSIAGDGSKSVESPKENSSMFHFSLYKWAGKGSPLLASLRGATNGSKFLSNNDIKKIVKDSSSSSNHIIADEERQDYETSSKTITEESKHDASLNGRMQKKADKPSQQKDSMSLRSFLEEPDNNDTNETSAGSTKTESSGENLIRNAVKGKIKGFAKIFDSAKPQNNNRLRSQSLRWDRATKFQMDNAASPEKPDEKLQWTSINKAKIKPDSSKLDTKNDKVSEEQKTDAEKIPPLNTSQTTSSQTDNKKPPEIVKPLQEDIDDILGDYFQVKELFNNEDKVLENEDNNQILESKIRQWAKGKEGNIRSLLSTLQFVLWPNSGWKPVALVDIIEGNAVKRAYQKTLLYLHPDKLQQRGAPPDQHYIARKVFDLLQEAWDHFNTVSQV